MAAIGRIEAATGIAIIGEVPTLIARTAAGVRQSNDRFWSHLSHRQPGGEHLVLQFAGALGAKGLPEQGPDLARLGVQQLGQHLGGIAVPGQGGVPGRRSAWTARSPRSPRPRASRWPGILSQAPASDAARFAAASAAAPPACPRLRGRGCRPPAPLRSRRSSGSTSMYSRWLPVTPSSENTVVR